MQYISDYIRQTSTAENKEHYKRAAGGDVQDLIMTLKLLLER